MLWNPSLMVHLDYLLLSILVRIQLLMASLKAFVSEEQFRVEVIP